MQRNQRNFAIQKRKKVLTNQCLTFQHLCINAKMTRIVILGLNAKKKNVFVKEIQQEMGNTVEVTINDATCVTVGKWLKEHINIVFS